MHAPLTHLPHLAGEDLGEAEAQINAIGLLVRLHVRDVANLGGRWRSIVDGIASHGPAAFMHAYPLHNLLRLVALCISGEDTAPLIDGLEAAAADGAASSPQLGETVLPLARAIIALLRDGDEKARGAIR